jgi:ribose transport system permease protein
MPTTSQGTLTPDADAETADTAALVVEAQTRALRRSRLLAVAQRQGLLLLLIGLVGYLWQASPYFMTRVNILAILGVAGVLGVMSIAQTPLIVSGGLDISVGSVISITTVTTIMLNNSGLNIWLSVVLALLLGAGIGALNGALVVWMGVNPLITTLGTMSIFSGLAYIISVSVSFKKDHPSFTFLGNGAIATLPMPFVIALVAGLIVFFVERKTVVGRAVYAIGGNRETARFAGLHVNRVPFLLYVISGLSGAIAGLLLSAQLGSASPDVGATYTLQVVTAVILGGTSLAGGRGSVVGTAIAVLFLGVLANGFTLLAISSYAQTVILGIALIVAVIVDQAAQKLPKV